MMDLALRNNVLVDRILASGLVYSTWHGAVSGSVSLWTTRHTRLHLMQCLHLVLVERDGKMSNQPVHTGSALPSR
jgi:hypothetical protein